MRRRFFFGFWLLLPVLFVALHYGPGQVRAARDAASLKVREAASAEKAGDWAAAQGAYAEALDRLAPGDEKARFKLRLAQSRARMYAGDLPEAMVDFQNLLVDMQGKAKPEEVRQARETLGMAQYYAGWLMRLEGAPADEWKPEVESARQNFRYLVENRDGQSKPETLRHQQNLEAAIRLERMDLSELEALPLPKDCPNCSNYSQRCRKQRQSRSKAPPKQPKDIREKITEQKNAGQGQRPGGTGS